MGGERIGSGGRLTRLRAGRAKRQLVGIEGLDGAALVVRVEEGDQLVERGGAGGERGRERRQLPEARGDLDLGGQVPLEEDLGQLVVVEILRGGLERAADLREQRRAVCEPPP